MAIATAPNSPPHWPGSPEHFQGGPHLWGYGHSGHESMWSWSLRQFGSNFGGQLVVDLLIATVALLAAVAVRHRRPWALGLNPAATCLAVGSLAVIGISTLTPRSNAWASGSIQLVPFHTLRDYLHQPANFLIYVGGNIALFLPLGFFLYLAQRRGFLRATLACALVSVSVEILQIPIWSRTTDVDDVITNTLGGFIGAALGAAFVYLARRGWLGRWLAGVVTDEPGLPARQDQLLRSPAAASVLDHAASPWPP